MRMPLPMSKSALDRLGARLAADARPSDDELDQLAKVIRAYQVVLDEVKAQFVELGYSPTTRVKTQGTLIEKLQREGGMRLSRVQDLAGARIVVSDRLEQDGARDRICAHFTAAGHACRVRDRREAPSHGYRAVHVIVQFGGIPVEVQIRTELQDSWAQIVERLGDQWGRGLRYGAGPEMPSAEVRIGDSVYTRQWVLATLLTTSAYINAAESAQAAFRALEGDDGFRALTDLDLSERDEQTAERINRLLGHMEDAKRTVGVMDERVRRILSFLAQETDEAGDLA
jgi:ppGpp synthetase/RelA/SpoT-type nucleotidyltranferase